MADTRAMSSSSPEPIGWRGGIMRLRTSPRGALLVVSALLIVAIPLGIGVAPSATDLACAAVLISGAVLARKRVSRGVPLAVMAVAVGVELDRFDQWSVVQIGVHLLPLMTLAIAVMELPVLRRADRQDVQEVESLAFAIHEGKVLQGLSDALVLRDEGSRGHSSRVAANALTLGRSVGLRGTDLEILRWAAILHDLGKIAVPEYILQKQGRLTADEFAEIRRHPGYGADLLVSISAQFRCVADAVRGHHERWDGAGYPLGYREQEIPLMARIIAISDVFEALTSERPYRNPMAPDLAMEYIRNGAGTQFDPALVPVFSDLYEAGLIEHGYDSRGLQVPILSPAARTAI